ncbi:14878_t:CDS:2 [Entrophospora sp. SA101]|nr:14878_t:CDS:2 [Entrophospora sp. SA101]
MNNSPAALKISAFFDASAIAANHGTKKLHSSSVATASATHRAQNEANNGVIGRSWTPGSSRVVFRSRSTAFNTITCENIYCQAKTKKPHTTLEERVQILLSLQNGHTTRQIAKSTNISPSTVSRINKRWCEQHSLKVAPKPGRPSTINETIKNKIVNLITSRRCSSAPEAQKCIEEKENIRISSPTIRHILHANGLRQLEFAKEHEHWTIEDWSKIIWSDEPKFKVFGSDGKQYYWKCPEEPLNHFHVKPTVKFGDGSVMIWGCFTSRGVGGFCRIDGMMDAKLYQQILHEDLMNTIKYHGFNVKEENLWNKIQQVWFEIDVETCTNLIHSMPERIHDVIKAQGGYTRW